VLPVIEIRLNASVQIILTQQSYQSRAGSRPKILGGHCHVSPFITESMLSVLRNRNKDELHVGLHFPASFLIWRTTSESEGTCPPAPTSNRLCIEVNATNYQLLYNILWRKHLSPAALFPFYFLVNDKSKLVDRKPSLDKIVCNLQFSLHQRRLVAEHYKPDVSTALLTFCY